MSIHIITDSTSYIPQEIVDQYAIRIVPLNINFNGETFKEGTKYSTREFFALLKNSTAFPHTSQPSAGDFIKVFNQLKPGDEALVILVSSKMSGTFHAAQMAMNMLKHRNIRISIVDSLSSGMGLGFQVIEACEQLAAGKTFNQTLEKLAEIRSKLRFFFVVDNLEYLVRGGRMSKISGKIGTILKIKPVLAIENGELALFQKVRTLPRALNYVLDELHKARTDLSKISILNVEYPEKAMKLSEMLQDKYSIPVSICNLGPVTGSHLGPGALGIVYY